MEKTIKVKGYDVRVKQVEEEYGSLTKQTCIIEVSVPAYPGKVKIYPISNGEWYVQGLGDTKYCKTLKKAIVVGAKRLLKRKVDEDKQNLEMAYFFMYGL